MGMYKCFPLNSFLIPLLCMWVVGCAGALEYKDLEPQTVGYQSVLPKAGTRVVVWGNHSMAVDNASMWLHQRGLVVLDRTKLQQGLDDKGVRLTGSSKDWAHILEAGKKIGADLVAFVEVSNVKEGQKFSLSQIRSAPSFSLTVEIRGVNPETGEIVTKSKSWQTGPADDSDWVIEGLTARALVGAWKSPTSEYKVLAINEEEDQEDTQVSHKSLSPPVLQNSAAHARTIDPEIETGTLSNLNDTNHVKANEDMTRSQRLSAPIHTNNVSTYENVESLPVTELSSPISHQQHAIRELPEGSKSISKPRSASTDKSELHEEVDSNYLNEMKHASGTERKSDSSSDSVSSQIASGALSILYTPAKLVYAGLGGIFGGLAYVLTGGDEHTADTIWDASLDGDYYLTPSHLRGDSPVHFMGSSSEGSVVSVSGTKEPFVARSSAFKK